MAEQKQTLKSIIRKGLIQEYKELLVPEYTLGWKMERWCREHEINSMSFDNTIAAILAEVDKAGLTDDAKIAITDEICKKHKTSWEKVWGSTKAELTAIDIYEAVAAAQLEAIKKQLRG